MKRVLFLLGEMSDLDIEWMINNGHKSKLWYGDQLISRNEPVENLYIVLSGNLSVTGAVKEAGEIARIGPGEVLGEMSLIESRPPSVNVSAVNECEIFVLSREKIENRIRLDVNFKAALYYSIALFLSDRLRKTTSQLGFGNPEEEDLLDGNVLDHIGQAGRRFDQILKKFSEV